MRTLLAGGTATEASQVLNVELWLAMKWRGELLSGERALLLMLQPVLDGWVRRPL